MTMRWLRLWVAVPAFLVATAGHAAFFGTLKSEGGAWMSGAGNAYGWGAGADIGYQSGNWFTGMGYLMNKFTVSTKAATLDRGDIDLMAGYRFNRSLMAFGGYKTMDIDYQRPSLQFKYNEQIQTFGAGVQYSIAIRDRWSAQLTGAVHLPRSFYKSDAQNVRSSGAGLSGEMKAAYWLNKSTNLNIGFKSQYLNLRYDGESANWPTVQWKGVASATHHF